LVSRPYRSALSDRMAVGHNYGGDSHSSDCVRAVVKRSVAHTQAFPTEISC
jgi:hypothetical protein